MDKKDEEQHSMSKPKPLEVISDGDLTEIKKDPVWKTWLEKTGSLPEREDQEEGDDIVVDKKGKKDTKREAEQRYEDKLSEKKRRIYNPQRAKDPQAMIPTAEQKQGKAAEEAAKLVVANRKQAKQRKLNERIRDAKWLEEFRARNTAGGKTLQTAKPSEFGIGDLDEEGKPPKSREKKYWESWEALKGALGALGEGKLNRRTGKPMKLVPRKTDREEKPTKKGQKRLEDFKSDSDYYMDAGGNPQRKEKKYTPKHPMTRVHNRESELRQEQHPHKRLLGEPDKTKPHKFCPTCGDKMPIETRRRVEEKADYFVEEIKANIIYYDKIFPLIGMIAGQVARGVGGAAKKIGGELLQDVGEVGQGMMEQEEEEQ